MRRIVLAAVVAVVASCTNDGMPNSADTAANLTAQRLSSSDWTLEATKSGIDGDTYTASRVYEFPDRRTQFQIVASCVANTGVTELTIDSYVGAPEQPEEGSAFLKEGPYPILMSPVGRAKASDGKVTDLRAYFSLGEDYNNRLRFDFNNPIAQRVIQEAPGYSLFASTVEEGDINYARLLLEATPMTIRVKNGAGEFELEIDKSRELSEALRSCGAAEPILFASYVSKAKAAEQTARTEVIKYIQDICGYRGIVRDTGEPWLETAETLSISLDCAASAPTEFANFNARIDGYLTKASERGIPCTREALLRGAAQQGIEDFNWDNNLQNYCSS